MAGLKLSPPIVELRDIQPGSSHTVLVTIKVRQCFDAASAACAWQRQC